MYGEDDVVDEVTVVGGGDAGLLTALILRKTNPELTVTVVDDFDEPVPQVGKSTISYILHTLHELLDIDPGRFASEVRPVWKASVYFEDWCGRGPFHVPFDDFTLLPSEPGRRRFEELYHRYREENFHTLGTELVERGLTPFLERSPGDLTRYDHVAYHLSSERFNGFLRELCDERGIELVNDRITEVRTDAGRIERVESDAAAYESELYVDATGFDRVLMDHLDNRFSRFDFPLDSAVVAKVPVSLSEIVPATVINSGPHGWFWQIDTFDWRDLGYVYSSEHVSDEEAARTFIDREAGISAADVQRYRFESGHCERAWVGNCIAVGNALGFVEPLQSTAVTLNAVLTEKLSTLLADHCRLNHEGIRNLYNAYARRQWTNVYDFISAHYRYSSGDNDFWEAMRSVEGENLSRYVEGYRENGFTSYDEFGSGSGDPGRRLFERFIFYRLLRCLGVDSDFYEDLAVDVRPAVKSGVQQVDRRIANDASGHVSYEEAYRQGVYGDPDEIQRIE